jgi:hypothetical protein
MHDLLLEIQISTSVRPVRVRSGRRTRATCPSCNATVRRTYCTAHDPDPEARERAHLARIASHRARTP